MLVARAWPLLLLCACFVDPGVSSGSGGSNTTTTTAPDPTSGGTSNSSSSSTTPDSSGPATDGSSSVDPTTGPVTTGALDTTGATTIGDTTIAAETTDTGSTTAPANPCGDDIYVDSLEIGKADLGDGTTYDDMAFGELVAFGSPGSYVEWTFNVTCDDAWRMFLRYPEASIASSYEIAIDGSSFIMDAGCTDPTFGMRWQIFNTRTPNADACETLLDPYTPILAAGKHTLRITFRDNTYVGSVAYSNGPDYEP